MLIASSVLLALIAFLIVVWPLLERRSAPLAASTASAELEALLGQRDAVFQALRDLRFDHAVGKVSDDDFGVFEASLKQSAAGILRNIDEWEATVDSELRRARPVAPSAQGGGARARVCSQCGRPTSSEDAFCSHCGAPLPEKQSASANTCPQCGRSFDPGDRFCVGCGGRLA